MWGLEDCERSPLRRFDAGGAMEHTVRGKHGSPTYERYIQDLLKKSREVVEFARSCVADSGRTQKRSKRLMDAARNLKEGGDSAGGLFSTGESRRDNGR